MSVVLILMDAMRSDYISKSTTPFLYDCAKKGEYYKKVIPNFGFCERTEIFTGQKPVESGFFTAIGYNPKDSPFKNLPELPFIYFLDNILYKCFKLSFFKRWGILYRLFRTIINKWIKKRSGVSPQNIPINLLPFWSLTEDLIDHRHKGAFKVESIFELLENADQTYFYDSFTALNLPHNGSDEDRLQMMLMDAKKNKSSFSLVYITTPDFVGHEFGPNSKELGNALKKMDSDLEYYTNEVLKVNSDTKFMFLGDHGMAKVEKYIDVESTILKIARINQLKLKTDYIYFLDSTLVRLWFFTDNAKSIFEDHLYNSQDLKTNGRFIDKKIAEEENIPWGDNRYGDMIWWANSGVLVYPDFFHRIKLYKGMHGYDTSLEVNNGLCIIYGKDVKKTRHEYIHLSDTYNILKRLLKL